MLFLGMTNFCRCWISNYAAITAPLTALINDSPMAASNPLTWTPTADNAFVEIKRVLVGSALLGLPDYDKVFSQTVDCKDGHMTSVLTQTHGTKERSLTYY